MRLIYNDLTGEDEEAEYAHRGDSSEEVEEEEDDSYPAFSSHLRDLVDVTMVNIDTV